MDEVGRATNSINFLSIEAWRAWLALIILFLIGLIVFAVGYFWLGTLPVQPIPTEKLMAGTLSEIVQWLGLTAMATAAVLGISEIKWFRDYLEHRLSRAIRSERENLVEALNEEVRKEVRNDFLGRSRDLAWLRRNLSQQDILAVRDAVIGASIANLDENRYAIVREHIYPMFDRPWRENYTIALTHSEVDGKFLVTTDVSWTYVNKTTSAITVPQTLRLILPPGGGSSLDEFLKQSRFEIDGTPIAVPWKGKETPEGRLQFEAKFDCNVKAGGSRCLDHREYLKPFADTSFIQRFDILTKDVTLSFSHPNWLRPIPRFFFFGESSQISESAVFHQWLCRGWFLEKHGLIVFWSQKT